MYHHIILSVTARAIPLAVNEPVAAGIPLLVTGWGTLSEGGGVPDHLQVVGVPLVKRSTCKYASRDGNIPMNP